MKNDTKVKKKRMEFYSFPVLALEIPNSCSPESDFHSQPIFTGNSRFRIFSFFFQLVSWILRCTEAILVPYDVYQSIGSVEISNKERVKIRTNSQEPATFVI